MRSFVYLIGTMDDFESLEDLTNTYLNGGVTERNMSVIPVELDPACRVRGYEKIEELATMIARGEAMSEGWCLDGTFSTLLEA